MAEYTKGPWFVCRVGGHFVRSLEFQADSIIVMGSKPDSPLPSVAIARLPDSQGANAQLIAEAGTVAHETGKTPRELAKENARLREALEGMVDLIDKLMPAVPWGKTFNCPFAELNEAPVKARAALSSSAGEER